MKEVEIDDDALEQFYDWFVSYYGHPAAKDKFNHFGSGWRNFQKDHIAMRVGVYLLWLGETTEMQIYAKPKNDGRWSVYVDNFGHHLITEYLYAENQIEALIEGINRAVKLINKEK